MLLKPFLCIKLSQNTLYSLFFGKHQIVFVHSYRSCSFYQRTAGMCMHYGLLVNWISVPRCKSLSWSMSGISLQSLSGERESLWSVQWSETSHLNRILCKHVSLPQCQHCPYFFSFSIDVLFIKYGHWLSVIDLFSAMLCPCSSLQIILGVPATNWFLFVLNEWQCQILCWTFHDSLRCTFHCPSLCIPQP